MAEAPDAERIWVGVTAREKMSVMWAREHYFEVHGGVVASLGNLPSSMVCVVRYCLD